MTPWSPSAVREVVRAALCRYRTGRGNAASEARLVDLLASDRAFDSAEAFSKATRGWRATEEDHALHFYLAWFEERDAGEKGGKGARVDAHR